MPPIGVWFDEPRGDYDTRIDHGYRVGRRAALFQTLEFFDVAPVEAFGLGLITHETCEDLVVLDEGFAESGGKPEGGAGGEHGAEQERDQEAGHGGPVAWPGRGILS